MTVRPATETDVDAVRRIARDAYALYVPRIGQAPAPMVADFAAAQVVGHLWVAGEPVMGFVVAYPRGDHWQLENVAVGPKSQGRGLGRRLIAAVERMAAAGGAQAVELYTNAAMTENQALYSHLGYRETERRREDGFERVFYRKELG